MRDDLNTSALNVDTVFAGGKSDAVRHTPQPRFPAEDGEGGLIGDQKRAECQLGLPFTAAVYDQTDEPRAHWSCASLKTSHPVCVSARSVGLSICLNQLTGGRDNARDNRLLPSL